jgi:protein SCO1/2
MFKSRQKNIIFGAGTVVLVLIVALGAWLAFFRSDSYAYKGGSWDPPHAASPLNLVDQNNKPFTLDQVKGKVTLLYFGYTYCPDFCPTTLTDFGKVKKELGTKASDVAVVFVTVDPDRDTPARMKQYLAFFDPTFIGLYGTQDQLTPIERDYGVAATKEAATPGTDYYSVSHTTSLYAIDQQGNLRLTWPYGTTPEDITSDVKHLLSSGS